MMLHMIVTVCHLATVSAPGITGEDGTLNIHPDPRGAVRASDMTLCHEETLFEGDGSMQMCMLPWAAVADWKRHSDFADDSWVIKKFRCRPGPAPKRNAI